METNPPPCFSLLLCGYYSVTHWNVGRYGIIFRLPDSFCSDSWANISHAAVVLPMSPLPWKPCIRGSEKAGCPLLIRRQGGKSLFLSAPVSSSCILFFSIHSTLLRTVRLKTLERQLCPSCHVLNQFPTQRLWVKLQRARNSFTVSRPYTQASTKLKLCCWNSDL